MWPRWRKMGKICGRIAFPGGRCFCRRINCNILILNCLTSGYLQIRCAFAANCATSCRRAGAAGALGHTTRWCTPSSASRSSAGVERHLLPQRRARLRGRPAAPGQADAPIAAGIVPPHCWAPGQSRSTFGVVAIRVHHGGAGAFEVGGGAP